MCAASPPDFDPSDGGVRRPRPTTGPRPTTDDLPERDHLHRLRHVWVHDPIYFITCCTAQRRKILTSELAAPLILSAWQEADAVHGWVIGQHVVMPDHVHFFARPRTEGKPLSAFVRDWKKWTARQIIAARGGSAPIWQPEFFDHVLRSARSYAEKWDYVRRNPVRAKLITAPDAWPYAGEGADLRW